MQANNTLGQNTNDVESHNDKAVDWILSTIWACASISSILKPISHLSRELGI